MIRCLKIQAVVLFLCICLSGCNSIATGPARISVLTPPQTKGQISLSIFDVFSLDDSVVTQKEIDSSGTTTLIFDNDHPTFAHLIVNGVEHSLFISPGASIVSRVTTDAANVARYGGESAGLNNYLAEASRIRSEAGTVNGKQLSMLDPLEFSSHLSSVEQEFQVLSEVFADTADLSAEESRIIREWNKAAIDLFRLTFSHDYTFRSGTLPDSGILEPDQMKLHDKLLQFNLREYGYLMQVYLHHVIYGPVTRKLAGIPYDSFRTRFIVAADSSIVAQNIPERIKEYLWAKNIDFQLSMDGITQPVEESFQRFRTRTPESPYISYLTKHYDRWRVLRAGEVAPEIAAVRRDGNNFSLSDLRGKVVYVDVWATWCGPCRDEIPYMKKLQTRFGPADSVEFLSVSVDRDRVAWEKMIDDEGDWNGVHVIQEARENSKNIARAYNIFGIPRYILIDANGRIVEANASRPSSGDVIYQKIRSAMALTNSVKM